jgi:two-component system nitrate/nitrite response regulator NarL
MPRDQPPVEGALSEQHRIAVRPTRIDVVRIIICSSIRLYREGLARVLGELTGIEVLHGAQGREECLALTETEAPDMVLLDMSTPGSADIVEELVATSPDVKVVALSVLESEPEVIAYARAGVTAYVTRDESLDDLVETVAAAARGESRCTPRTSAMLMRAVRDQGDHRFRLPGRHLTPREREILKLLEEGLQNKQIARRLCIELPTVKNHVHHLLEKLGVETRAEAVARVRGTHR